MKKIALFFLLMFIAVSAFTHEKSYRDLADVTSGSVVQVYSDVLMFSSFETNYGSGFFINDRGDIATSYHIIEGSVAVSVETQDGDLYLTEVLFVDRQKDMAVLRILEDQEVKDFKAVSFGDSDKVRRGDIVASGGYPLGMNYTFSVGVISNESVDISLVEDVPMIQTDAMIALGSSGGALFDINGDVVGLITGSVAMGGEIPITGIGYCTPANILKDFLEKGFEDEGH
jgi:S1-C subfamily serine protease